MRDLLDAVASGRAIPHDDLANAHKARKYRNRLLHERDEEEGPIPLPTFRRFLCMYLHYLPPSW